MWLLADLQAGVSEDGELSLNVQLARAPTPEEAEQLERVINQAVNALEQGLSRQGQA